jgi:2-dehydropantoate 2-reductase
MRIAIHGTGGAGGYFGARLARAGHDVTFIARGEHLRAIRDDGLRVETPHGEIRVRPATATDDPGAAGTVDAVLLGVKTWQVSEAADQVAAVLGADRVLGGLCGTCSWVTAPGRIRSIGASHFVRFGELDNSASERTERLRLAFEKAGVDVRVPRDIRKALWDGSSSSRLSAG